MEKRIRILSIGFIAGIFVLIVRLFFWQIIQGEALAQQGRYQQQGNNLIPAERGDILANDGSWLAASAEAWLLYANPQEITETPHEIADKLAPLFVSDVEDDPDTDVDEHKAALGLETDKLANLLSKDKLVWVNLKDKIDSDTKNKIKDMNIAGLGFQQDEMRIYPEASSAAQVMGFVGKNSDGEDTGYFGLEGYYNQSLAGKHGFTSREQNALGAPIIFGNSKESSAIQGVNLVTNIDKTVQLTIEKYLREGLEKYEAESGTVIVMRPQDGAVLGMASLPSYDPAKYYEYGDEFFRNPAISDGFEPGSVMKPVVMSAGIDAGVVTPDTRCDICAGPYKVDKYYIRTWNNEYRPNETMTDVIVHSDNVGMSFVGNRLGADKLYDYLSSFGFGQLTGIDLQGEVTPKLRERGSWNIVDLATASFGQGIAVTPIQMVRAIATIANGGRSPVPQVVDKVQVADKSEDIKPIVGGQIISEEAARKTTAMMVRAVVDGEAKWAAPKNFSIAGKTGTAQIPVSGHYDSTNTIASFVGFSPAVNPKFAMLVTLKEPKSSPWAAETAAPLWFNIAEDLFPYFGIQPEK